MIITKKNPNNNIRKRPTKAESKANTKKTIVQGPFTSPHLELERNSSNTLLQLHWGSTLGHTRNSLSTGYLPKVRYCKVN